MILSRFGWKCPLNGIYYMSIFWLQLNLFLYFLYLIRTSWWHCGWSRTSTPLCWADSTLSLSCSLAVGLTRFSSCGGRASNSCRWPKNSCHEAQGENVVKGEVKGETINHIKNGKKPHKKNTLEYKLQLNLCFSLLYLLATYPNRPYFI